MATGTIKTILQEKGFGFIAPEGQSGRGSDLFFHHTAVAEGQFDTLNIGQQVDFDEEPDPRDASRRRAVNVRPAGEEAY